MDIVSQNVSQPICGENCIQGISITSQRDIDKIAKCTVNCDITIAEHYNGTRLELGDIARIDGDFDIDLSITHFRQTLDTSTRLS